MLVLVALACALAAAGTGRGAVRSFLPPLAQRAVQGSSLMRQGIAGAWRKMSSGLGHSASRAQVACGSRNGTARIDGCADGHAPMLTMQLTERSELAGADLLAVLERLAAGLGCR